MATIQFDNGTKVKFDGNPAPQDVEEVATKLGINKPANSSLPEKPAGLGGFDKFLQTGSKIADTIFGGGKVGEAIGTQAAKLGLTGLSKEERQNVSKGPSIGEVAGSAAKSALLFAPVGRGASALGGGLAKLGVPAAQTLGKIGAGAGLGYGFDVASDLEQKKSIGEIITPGVGTVVGAALPIAGLAVNKLSETLSKSLPERLVKSALKMTPKEVQSKGGQKAVEQVLKGRAGTAKGLLQESRVLVDTLDSQIDEALKTIPTARIGKIEISKNVISNPFFRDAGLSNTEVVDEVVRLVPRARSLLGKKNLTLTEANRLRQIIDSTLGDTFFNQANPTFSKDLLNAFSRTLSDTVKSKGPKGTQKLFEELSREISLRNQLLKASTRGSGNQIISFGDLIGGGIGTALGGAPGTIAGIAARRAIQSTPSLTGGAQVSKAIGSGLERLQNIPGSPTTKFLLGNLSRLNQSQK